MAKKQADNGMSSDFNDKMMELHRQWFEACYLSGVKPFSDDKCFQILAWTYIYGSEECIYNVKFNGAIRAAQKRHNIFGGEKPSVEAVLGLQKYIKSVTDLEHPPRWVYELEKEFDIKIHGEHK